MSSRWWLLGALAMSSRWWMLGALALSSVAGGCGGSAPAPAVGDKVAAVQGRPSAPASKAPMPTVAPRIPEAGPPLPPLSYETKGRRDPFAPITPAIEKSKGIDVSTLKLVGIIEGRQPLALVDAPDGLGYILKAGDMLGNGRVTDIARGAVTFAVAARGGERDASVTLRLRE
jgi:Tfp pilus assembly protein PilP